MKHIHTSIEVEAEGHRPTRIYWDGSTYHIQNILDYWILQGRWWAAEERRVYLRLGTRRSVMEVYRSGEEWTLSKVLD